MMPNRGLNATGRSLKAKGKAELPQIGEADYLGMGMRERDTMLKQLMSHPELSEEAKAAAGDIYAKSQEQQKLLGPLGAWEQVAKAGVNPEHVASLAFDPGLFEKHKGSYAREHRAAAMLGKDLGKDYVNAARMHDGSLVHVGMIKRT